MFFSTIFDFYLRAAFVTAHILFPNGNVYNGRGTMCAANGTVLWQSRELEKHSKIRADDNNLYVRSDSSASAVKCIDAQTAKSHRWFFPERVVPEVIKLEDKTTVKYWGTKEKREAISVDKFALTNDEVVVAHDNKLSFFNKVDKYKCTGTFEFEDNAHIKCIETYGNVVIALVNNAIVHVDRNRRGIHALVRAEKGFEIISNGRYIFAMSKQHVIAYDLEMLKTVHVHQYNSLNFYDMFWIHGKYFFGHQDSNSKEFACYKLGDDTPVWNLHLGSRAIAVKCKDDLVFIHTANGEITVVENGQVIDKLASHDFLKEAEVKFSPALFHFNVEGDKVHVLKNGILVDTFGMNELKKIAPYAIPEPILRFKGDTVYHEEFNVLQIAHDSKFEDAHDMQKNFEKTIPLTYDEYRNRDFYSYFVTSITTYVHVYRHGNALYPILLHHDNEDQTKKRVLRTATSCDDWTEIETLRVFAIKKLWEENKLVEVGKLDVSNQEKRVEDFAALYPDVVVITRLDGELKYGLKK